MSDENDEEHLTPTASFASSFGAPAPVQTFGRSSHYNAFWNRVTSIASVPANATRPRLRLDPPLPQQQRHASQTQHLFPEFSSATATLAPAALALLVRTLLPPEPTPLVQLTARILYPGENSYGTVWADVQSPVSHILRNVCGGKIDMRVKRGALATGLTMTALPQPQARCVSTCWESWQGDPRVGATGIRRRERKMGVVELDEFLVGEIGGVPN
jgi:hypothetical protein